MSLFKRLMGTAAIALIGATSLSAAAFVVKKIEFAGLQRVRPDTVRNYLTLKEGDELSSDDTRGLVEELYQTGFFEDINIARNGNTLVIRVTERPVISTLKITGNSEIKTEDITKALRENGITEGLTYDRSTFFGIRNAIESQYHALGRYNAKVHASVKQLKDNRVQIDIDIFEGQVAKISDIHIVGNHAFSEKVLRKQFQLTNTKLWSFITHNDRYSSEKLNADLETLRSYYMDRGYLEFRINSTQVTITPDKKDVFITINITEGPVFYLQDYEVTGDLIDQATRIRSLVCLRKGKPFSRRELIDTQKLIIEFYADRGYAFAKVDIVPTIHNDTHQVSIKFICNPGRRVYVRQLSFEGNTRTCDEVIRREMRQFEGAIYSQAKVKEGKRRLSNLGYLEKVEVQTKPVPGHPDLVDVHYQVSEAAAASATAQLGYSDSVGLVYGANVSHKNFLGTGNAVALGFESNSACTNYNFSYFKPYVTLYGIGAGFNVFYQKTTPGHVGISNYKMDSYGAGFKLSIPISDYNAVTMGLGYSNIQLIVNQVFDPLNPTSYQTFIEQNGTRFDQFTFNIAWNTSTYDQAIFPTSGYRHSLGATVGVPLTHDSLCYYKLNYDGSFYQPLYKGFIFHTKAKLGYGNGYGETGDLPFFLNYYAGGMDTVRAVDDNSLGPIDTNLKSIGGTILTAGSLELVFPQWFGEHVRYLLFLDAGNVYNPDFTLRIVNPQGTVLEEQSYPFDLGRLHYSTGVNVEWISPFGPLRFALGLPLNKVSGEFNKTHAFQFSVGTSL